MFGILDPRILPFRSSADHRINQELYLNVLFMPNDKSQRNKTFQKPNNFITGFLYCSLYNSSDLISVVSDLSSPSLPILSKHRPIKSEKVSPWAKALFSNYFWLIKPNQLVIVFIWSNLCCKDIVECTLLVLSYLKIKYHILNRKWNLDINKVNVIFFPLHICS